jgi:hypothetical protein
MGLLVAAFVSSFRLGIWTRARTRIQARSIQLLVPSVLPLATTAAGGHIDYAAHLGGAVACAVPALLLLKTWPEMAPLPRFRQAAAGVALAGLLLISLSAAAAASHFSAYASVASRIPVEFHRLSPDLARPPELADVDPQLLTNCPFVKATRSSG